jgi:hypothetical protein
MLGQATQIQNQVSSLHLCKVLAWNLNLIPIFVWLSWITKMGEIESPIFGFGNWDNLWTNLYSSVVIEIG